MRVKGFAFTVQLSNIILKSVTAACSLPADEKNSSTIPSSMLSENKARTIKYGHPFKKIHSQIPLHHTLFRKNLTTYHPLHHTNTMLKSLTAFAHQEKPDSPYRIFRENLGFSVAELSKKLDLSDRMIYKAEVGAVHTPTSDIRNVYAGLLSKLVKPNLETYSNPNRTPLPPDILNKTHLRNCMDFWDLLWENYIIQSLNSNNLPENWEGRIPFRNLAPRKDDDLDRQWFNLDVHYLADVNYVECTPYNVGCIMKMSDHPIGKYMNRKMKNRPAQFTERMRLWDEILQQPEIVINKQGRLGKFADERFERAEDA